MVGVVDGGHETPKVVKCSTPTYFGVDRPPGSTLESMVETYEEGGDGKWYVPVYVTDIL